MPNSRICEAEAVVATHPCIMYLEYHLRRFDEYCSRMAVRQALTPEEQMLLSRIRRANRTNMASWRETLTSAQVIANPMRHGQD